MKTAVTAALCLMLAAAPSIAQDQVKDGGAGAPAAKQTTAKSGGEKQRTAKSGGEKQRTAKSDREKQAAKKPLTEKQQKQQAKFRDCSQQAKGRKGDDRKEFMKQCLSHS